MKFSSLARAPRRIALTVAVLSFAALPCLPLAAQSDEDAPRSPTPTAPQPAKPPAPDKTAEAHPLPPLPPDAHVEQSITLDGKKLTYTVTVGTLFVRDAEGKAAGQLVYTAYTVDGPNRPVTFAFNGGPGASCVYLNFGAIGPKHLNARQRRRQPLRSRHPHRQSRHLARLHRPRLHRSHRHRLQPLPRSRRTRPRSSSTPPNRTSSTSRASSTTGWSRTTVSSPASTSSAKATADSAARASPITCSRSSASP